MNNLKQLQRQGLSLPIKVSHAGGAQKTTGSAQTRKLLLIALSDCVSRNPFQDLGLNQSVVFNINDQLLWGIIEKDIKDVFASFNNRVKYLKTIFTPDFQRGELKADITYEDLEEGIIESVETSFG